MQSLKVLGDVHLGRQFLNDVPLHRRGERELEVFQAFTSSLDVPLSTNMHVQVGDLFDAFTVDNAILLQTVNAYLKASEEHRLCQYVLYPGNHDMARDADKVSSFQLFYHMVRHRPNIHVFFEPTIFQGYGFLPWHPFKTSTELAEALPATAFPLHSVFCHCDTKDYSGRATNVVPTAVLASRTKLVVTGHVHTPSTYEENGVTVQVVGSMQPYSHGEDPEGTRYITVTSEELRALSPEYLHNKYVRVRLTPKEEAPAAPDCLGFKTVLLADSEETIPDRIEVKFEDFSTRNLFAACLAEKEVSQGTQVKILEKFDAEAT